MMKIFCKLMPILVGYDILEEYGFEPSNSFQRYLCSLTSPMGYAMLLGAIIYTSGFLAFEAKTFDEVSEHFYEFATALNETFYFIFIHWNCTNFFELNENYEEIMKKREYFL